MKLHQVPDIHKRLRGMVRMPSVIDYKGNSGRLLVIGGSIDYTGAPYFAAMSAMRAGADLATVLCPPEASVPIKAYSPDLIVRPLLPSTTTTTSINIGGSSLTECTKAIDSITAAMARAHSIIIGPGMSSELQNMVLSDALLTNGPSTVIDATGLTTMLPSLKQLRNSPNRTNSIVLTPNINEIKILFKAVSREGNDGGGESEKTPDEMSLIVSQSLNCCVLLKGREDVIIDASNSRNIISTSVNSSSCFRKLIVDASELCALPISMRRAGGQGDVLSGLVGTFLGWNSLLKPENQQPTILCVAAASLAMKIAASRAYRENQRYLASDVLAHIGPAIAEIANISPR